MIDLTDPPSQVYRICNIRRVSGCGRAFQSLQTRQKYFQVHEKVSKPLIVSSSMFDSLPWVYVTDQVRLVLMSVVAGLRAEVFAVTPLKFRPSPEFWLTTLTSNA